MNTISSRIRDRLLGIIQIMWVTGFFAGSAYAQTTLDGWIPHTSMRSAVDVSVGEDAIWTATTGGVFSYVPQTGEITRYTIVNGLSGIEPTTIEVDQARNALWIGYGDGILDRLDLENGDVRTFRDIARAQQFADRGINALAIRGDSLLIATNFGIVVMDPALEEVRDSYTRLGTVAPGSAVSDVLAGPDADGVLRLWAATGDGVAHIPLNAPNLQDPGLWSVDRSGLSGNALEITSLAFLGADLYAGTGSDVYRRDATGHWSRIFASSARIGDLEAHGSGLIGVDVFRVFLVRESGAAQSMSLTGITAPSAVYPAGDGTFWLADLASGLSQVSNPFEAELPVEPLRTIIPTGPWHGRFRTVQVGPEGSVWLGGEAGVNNGFFRLKDGEWTNFIGSEFPAIAGKDRFHEVYPLSEDEAWAASEGGGVVHVDLADEGAGEVTAFGIDNSSLRPAAGTESFIIASGVFADSDDNIWVTTTASNVPLHVRQPDGTWTGLGPQVGQGLTQSSTAYGRLYIDSFDQKWIIVRSETNFALRRGLLVLDTGRIDDPSDDEFQFYDAQGGSGQGLPSTDVFAVEEDLGGLVWIGTSSGPAYFINTGIIARDASATAIWPQWADRSQGTFMLFGLAINDIAVDPANRVWFATNDGVWLVQAVEGGYELVEHFTRENSPLFSNAVNSIAVDPESGVVYMSTDVGLVAYASDAIAPSSQVRNLHIFPNPVRIGDGTVPDIYIEGMVESTQIRITTAAGSLVRRLQSRGGRIRWDGRDESGTIVSSGVYLIMAVGDNDEGTAYGKVAVIR